LETTFSPTTLLALKPGDHLCCVYDTEEEHRAVITPFPRQGLEQAQKVVYVAEDHTREQVLAYLENDGCHVPALLASGQLVVVSPVETYLRRGAFDPDDMIAFLRSETERALAVAHDLRAPLTDRPYRKALPPAEAFTQIWEETSRGWWDKNLLTTFEQLFAQPGKK